MKKQDFQSRPLSLLPDQTSLTMYRILGFSVMTLLLFSCMQDPESGEGGSNSTDVVDLQNQVRQLELDNAMKDSMINESLAFFNEIKSNLEAIGIRKDEIRALSSDPELSTDDRQWILQEIKHINFLREENTNTIKRLQKQMKDSGLKINELEVMIESLMKEMQWKDEQISMLQSELKVLDEEYSRLFDAYQEQAQLLDVVTDELNSVYYAYGSEEELSENGVIDRRNGFMGIGKKTSLKEDFNDKYFTRVDARSKKTITIEGANVRFVTNHPKSSYTLQVEGARTRVTIKDASEFWKLSKYLVVIVD